MKRDQETFLKQRTARLEKELAAQKRELQIETALEKVRAIALSMKEPAAMLEVCRVIALQLEKLGTKEIRNVQTAIFYEAKGTYMNYEYYAKHKKTVITETSYTNHKISKAFATKMLKGKGELFITHIKGKKVQEWIAYQKTTNVFIDKYLKKASSLNYYWCSLGPVALGISTYVALSKEDIQLFNRFRNVFELCYCRFKDIEQAIAQTREAEIELALERVRARTMAMQKSEELAETAFLLLQQFNQLGETPEQITIGIINEPERVVELWLTLHGNQLQHMLTISIDEPFVISKAYAAWKKHKKSLIIDLQGRQLKAYNEYRNSLSDFKVNNDRTEKRRVINFVFFSRGQISVSAPEPMHDEGIKLLERFAAVFDGTYTRFLDLQKAEAQARESQIELALERVRARTMAMQKSNELDDVAAILFNQVSELGIRALTTGFNVWSDDSNFYTDYVTSPHGNVINTIDATHFSVFKEVSEAKKNGVAFLVQFLEGDLLKKTYKKLIAFDDEKQYEKMLENGLQLPAQQYNHFVFGPKVSLMFITYEPVPEAHDVFKRFGKVFEQTYTRFLDLQKAEAQAREAKIEAALERVRSRAMAMHKTDELLNAAELVYKELTMLGITSMAISYAFVNEEEKNALYYGINPVDGKIPPIPFVFPHTETDVMLSILSSWKKQEPFYVIELDEKATLKHQTWVGEHIQTTFAKNKIPFSVEAFLEVSPQTAVIYSFHFTQGYLFVIGEESLSAMQEEMLLRFTKVFEMTYRRFLDLQKAEAQAREAEIELALERVRARTMAMQHSDELADVATILFHQVKTLGVPQWLCGFSIFEIDDKEFTWYPGSPDGDILPPCKIPLTEHPVFISFNESRKRGDELFVYEKEGEFQAGHYRYMQSLPGLGEMLQKILDAGLSFPTFQIDHLANFSHGNLAFITYEHFPEMHDIFIRFAKVFEQTYTRFLDLQKAEAQARESQIELGLERVRARAMAMQKSEELAELVHTVFKELTKLHLSLDRCIIMIYDPQTNGSTWWMSNSEESSLPIGSFVKYHEYPPYLAYVNAWKGRTLKWKYLLEGAIKKEWDDFIFSETDLSLLPPFIIEGMKQFEHIFLNASFNNFGSLTLASPESLPEEHSDILLRFAKVFDLTYTRFNDLQKAEAQAKEAQIEAALERVRSRSMGMQKSEELKEVIQVVYDQFVHLGINIEHTGFVVDYKPKADWHFWIADKREIPSKITHPYFDSVWASQFNEAKEKEKEFFTTHLNFEEKNKFYQDLLKHIPGLPEEAKEFYFSCPGLAASTVLLENVGLYIENFSGTPYTDEENNTLMRFGKVFQQTYTRFLDLQKAEAQAREAKIEAALERTRTQSMIMQHSKELDDTLRVFHEQVQLLGIHSAFSFLWLPDEEKDKHIFWAIWEENLPAAEAGNDEKIVFKNKAINYPLDRNEPATKQCLIDWKADEPVVSYAVPPKGVENYFAAWRELIDGVETLTPEHFRSGLHYIEAFMKYGCFGVMLENDLTKDEKKILGRFAIEFERTYTRFLDLQKAEAQAREAQIELGLERVRARAMAMQNSNELAELVDSAFKELTKLHFTLDRCIIIIIDKNSISANYWMANPEVDKTPRAYNVKLGGIPYFVATYNGWKERNPKWIYDLKGADKSATVEYLFGQTELKLLPPEAKKGMMATDRIFLNTSFNNFGGLQADTVEPLSDENLDILYRFSKVFDMTYTRFNDLKQAEAQAREATIESALEKIRSRSLGMHRSDELKEVIAIMFEKLNELNVLLGTVGIWLFNKATMDSIFWVGNDLQQPSMVSLPYDEQLIKEDTNYRDSWQAWINGEGYINKEYTFEQKNKYFNYVFGHNGFDVIPAPVREIILQAPKHIASLLVEKNSSLFFDSWQEKPYSEASISVLKRVSKVFEQAYVRFLDLQKAEAQAKEAQIEAALERVRSRTMAMHQSQELLEVIKVVSQQLQQLGFRFDHVSFGINNQAQDYHFWTSMANTLDPRELFVPYLDNPIFENIRKAQKEQLTFFTDVVTPEENNQWTLHMLTHMGKDFLSEDVISYIHNKGIARSVAILPNIFLIMAKYNPIPYLDRENEILKRFGQVFDQTYTRFLDLQKAEAQAKESHVQLAMERVRARTMAMQQSSELPDAANILFQQVQSLGMPAWSAGYCIWDDDKKAITLWMSSAGIIQQPFKAPLTEDPSFIHFFDAYQRGETFYVEETGGDELVSHYKYMCKLPVVGDMLNKFVEDGGSLPFFQIFHLAFFSQGFLLFITYEQVPEAHDIFKRFGKVFEQTYTRFLDLQKAEAQARESQIQLALERVRARTMAMQHSNELQEASNLLFLQVQSLGIPAWSCGYNVWEQDEKVCTGWMSSEGMIQPPFKIPLTENPTFRRFYESRQKAETFYVEEVGGEALVKHYQYMLSLPDFAAIAEHHIKAGYPFPSYQINHVANFARGNLIFITNTPVPEAHDIFKRFAKVFEQTYTRFLDLQKAEAQAREARIETAMEKVRARAMSMQKPDELVEVAQVLRQEMGLLGVEELETSSIYIHHEETGTTECWYAIQDKEEKKLVADHMVIDVNDTWVGKEMLAFYRSDEKQISIPMKGRNRKEWINYCSQHSKLLQGFYGDVIPDRTYHLYKFSNGYMGAASPGDISVESWNLLQRATTVFSLAYTRFSDLQQAEAQAREAQVEASLERVRSKTMAMHNSQDVGDTVAAMFAEFVNLGIYTNRCGILIFNSKDSTEVWTARSNPEGKATLIIGRLDLNSHQLLSSVYEAWKAKESFYQYNLLDDDLKRYYESINKSAYYQIKFDIESLPSKEFHSDFFFAEGAVFSFTKEPVIEEHSKIIKRFAGVFGQTYRRYLDLQKAEAQAREATIEAALEKVRGKAMAMHNSNDLSITASMVFTELRKLGISPIRCGVGLLNKQSRKAQLYSATSTTDGDSLSLVGWAELSGHPVLEKIYDTWLTNKDYYPQLQGEQLKSYYELLLGGLSVKVPDWEDGQKQYGNFLSFSVGCLYAWSDIPYNDAEIKILKRFATIIDLTFRRYIELQTSEANAREAVKQAALDRIRADIASMRTITDLERITPLIWNELTILGIPFIRCGVFIMDEPQQLIHTFLSTPDGKAIAAFHIPYASPGNVSQVLTHWQHKENYIDHWDEEAFAEFANTLVKQGALASSEQYLKTIPTGGFHLHFLPFLQGMLYVGNTNQLSEEEIKLIQSIADAFSTAYARYEDFNKLEAAKQQVDKTLDDLKQAQTQLIQSEKMASLGELTAGIAHEIQNPLNFVNNFSEVSNELIEELKGERQKVEGERNTAVEDELLNDIEQNLQKINHHGKRADAIVKGMLQHSRSSSATKEPTDINTLADEYLRLCYHGLRAKDKSFNAAIKTDFDAGIEKINIIPQDIGRVLLNLLTNAFYAVQQKQKEIFQTEATDLPKLTLLFDPTVSITTKKVGNKVEIIVSDNGNGIPQNIVDKIFQPFFTTKPTGQGTGLGLSLSYDIIKAHGGEIKVETKEGEGTTFIIQLPAV